MKAENVIYLVVWIMGMLYVGVIHSWPGVLVASVVSGFLLILYKVDGPNSKLKPRENGSIGTIDDIGNVKVWEYDEY